MCASKDKSFLGLLSEASGQWDLMESDPPASPFGVQRLLMSRSVAWALVGFCHLSYAKKLVDKFLVRILSCVAKSAACWQGMLRVTRRYMSVLLCEMV